MSENFQEMRDKVGEQAEERLSTAKDALGRAADIVADRASKANEKISGQVNDAKENISRQIGSPEKLQNAIQDKGAELSESPMAKTVGALAVGVLIGLLLPFGRSRVREMSLQEKITDIGRDLALEAARLGQQAAKDAVTSAASALENAQKMLRR